MRSHTLRTVKENHFEDVEELHLLQDRAQWHACVNIVMKL
jgi:hypothetical protein